MKTLEISLVLLGLASVLACATLQAGDDPVQAEKAKPVTWCPVDQEPELGQVRWLRSYDAARELGQKTGRPLFVLFDEVPG